MPVFDRNELFVPNEDATAKGSVTGAEKVYLQDGNGNEYLTAQQIANLGSNVAATGTDSTPGPMLNKIASTSPIKFVLTNVGAANELLDISLVAKASGSNDLDLITTYGLWSLDTGTHGTSLGGYTNFPAKLSSVSSYIDVGRVIIENGVWSTRRYQKLYVVIAFTDNTVMLAQFIREYHGASWFDWFELTSAHTYTVQEKNLNNLIWEGSYSFINDGGSGDHTDFSNLPSDIPTGVADLDALYANLDESVLNVQVIVRNDVSIIQTLKVLYIDGANSKVYSYERAYRGGAWTPWSQLVGSGGGGVATNISYTANPGNGLISSSTGSGATVPLADGTNAGLMSPAHYTQVEALDKETRDGSNGVTYYGTAGALSTSLASGTLTITVADGAAIEWIAVEITAGNSIYANGLVTDSFRILIDNTANGSFNGFKHPIFMSRTSAGTVNAGNPLQYNTAINVDIQCDLYASGSVSWIFQDIPGRASAGGVAFF